MSCNGQLKVPATCRSLSQTLQRGKKKKKKKLESSYVYPNSQQLDFKYFQRD